MSTIERVWLFCTKWNINLQQNLGLETKGAWIIQLVPTFEENLSYSAVNLFFFTDSDILYDPQVGIGSGSTNMLS